MMRHRIEISPLPKWRDPRGEAVKKQIETLFKFQVGQVVSRDVYTVSADIDAAEAAHVAAELANPVIQAGKVGETPFQRDWTIVVGFRPGVTDNVGHTARVAIGDILGRRLRSDEQIFSSVEYLLRAEGLRQDDLERIAWGLLANKLIQTATVLDGSEPIPLNLPLVDAVGGGNVREIDLEVSDAELTRLSSEGVLALTLDEMKVIQAYFRAAKRKPTDVELEAVAQSWSEHCKHKIFDAEIDYEDENGKHEKIVSCFKTFIKNSTEKIGKDIDWLVSVFHDGSGVVAFDDHIDVAYKVETHNSPSALDPYGGAMTGIVGVNRDPMSTGQGAELLINVWGYCLGSPFTPDAQVPQGLLRPRRLRDGVHKGVIDGGNQSGIPYGLGWEFFDDRYLGKPLVFCGTVGTLPKEINGVPGASKSIKPGDLIVMAGGRIGKDGIHGATFSSEELHQGSPVQAVQIGDPITQKMLGDFIYEARDRGLYRFTQDNGAGGLSSSVGEMAGICGGCDMDLALAPLKYAGLDPWEILVSEAQERISYAVPPEHIDEFKALAAKRDVEVTVLGTFTDTGKFHMLYNGKTVACVDMDFLDHGLPRMKLKAKWTPPHWDEPKVSSRGLATDVVAMLGRLNVCSDEFKARQYDHEVKGLSVVKPFGGVARDVAADATVYMAEPLGKRGIVLAAAVLPRYSDIDTYHMMAATIDLAVRRAIAAGAGLDRLAGLDNFCWPDPVQSEKTPDGEYKLAQLVRANQALYDYTIAFKTPLVSGKDSMKNDCVKGGRKISIPPTVLFSVLGQIADVSKAVTFHAKAVGDLVYVLGETKPELGGSEFYAMLGAVGNRVPRVDAAAALELYRKVVTLADAGLARSLHAPGIGGLAVSFAKTALGGRLGLDLDLAKIPAAAGMSAHEILFSESASRLVLTVAPRDAAAVELALAGHAFAKVGVVTANPALKIAGEQINLSEMLNSYKATLDGV